MGNIKRHKGLAVLLEAFLAAKKQGFPHTLVILGEKDNFRTKDSKTLGLLANAPPEEVVFTGPVSDGELARLYRNAAFLVQPSLYEGFGLPPLEALVCGTPVLLSDIPVFREIYGDFPVTFFPPGNPEALCAALVQGANNTGELPADLKNRHTFKKTAATILTTLTGGV